MHVNPEQVHLSPEQQSYIASQAERLGKPWPELLEQLVPTASTKTSEAEVPASETAYDAAKRLGLIGGVRSGCSDLSTNPKHMEGFGRD